MAVGQTDEAADFGFTFFIAEFFRQSDALLAILYRGEHIQVAVLPAKLLVHQNFVGIGFDFWQKGNDTVNSRGRNDWWLNISLRSP